MRTVTLLMIIAVMSTARSPAQSTYVDALAGKGKLEVPLGEARKLESRLGQLFIVNVDGFDYSGPLALKPDFVPMIEGLQVGGVIPHYASTDYEKIRQTNQALAGMTKLPLLLCCDIVKLKGIVERNGTAPVGSFGDGYVGGFLGKFKRLPDAELETLARLNAFALAAIGINVPLGPTVDSSTNEARTVDRARVVVAQMKRFGLEPVLKHFPYLPADANLHAESPDTRVPLPEVEKRFAVFHDLADQAGIMMTTHLFNSLVDGNLVTFSSIWNGLLRKRTGFRGLLMSDDLLMMEKYADRGALSGGPTAAEVADLSDAAIWALRSILAGHDFIIVAGSAAQTSRVFEGLLTVACRSSPLGRRLKARIEESYGKIVKWKKDREAELRRVANVPVSALQAAIRLLPSDGADLASFRFDPEALRRLEPALRAAERVK